MQGVSPNDKAGWTIDVKKTGTGDGEKVTELDWTNGSIPVGQRDDFLFSAQAPHTSTTLAWKVFQTYVDGTVANWDQAPGKNAKESDTAGPYSVTTVINDLQPKNNQPVSTNTSNGTDLLTQVESYAGVLALILSLVALYRSWNTTETSRLRPK